MNNGLAQVSTMGASNGISQSTGKEGNYECIIVFIKVRYCCYYS